MNINPNKTQDDYEKWLNSLDDSSIRYIERYISNMPKDHNWDIPFFKVLVYYQMPIKCLRCGMNYYSQMPPCNEIIMNQALE